MSTLFFLFCLCFLGIVFLIIGAKSAKAQSSKVEFFLGKRDLGVWPLTTTFFAAQIGGGALLGTAEEAFVHGWKALAYPAGLVLGMLLIASGAGARLREFELVTVSEVLERVYGSRLIRLIAALLFITSLLFLLVAQCLAARKFFSAIGFQNPIYFFVFWTVMIFYTANGGLKAVIRTDIIQGIVKLASLLCLFAAVCLNHDIPKSVYYAFEPTSSAAPWVDWLLLPPLFLLIAQDMGQRCFAAKTPQTVTRAAILSALLFAAVSAIPVYFGILAKQMNLVIEGENSVLLTAAIAFTNPYISALCACGVVMAIISISNSLLCSISSQICYDVPVFRNKRWDTSLDLAKAITFITGVFACGISYFFTNVVSLIVISYELSVAILFVPIFAILINRPMSKNTCLLSMSLAALTYLLPLGFIPIPSAVLALTVAGIVPLLRGLYQNA